MMPNLTTEDREAIIAATRTLIEGSVLVAFRYDSGFTVHFQHDVSWLQRGLPVEVSLVLRGRWWPSLETGIPPEFSALTGRLSCKPEQPYQAFKLMSFVGLTAQHAKIAADGTLTIALNDGNTLQVSGQDDEWEFSWYVFVPSDFPSADTWSISCAANGTLSGSWPTDAHFPQK